MESFLKDAFLLILNMSITAAYTAVVIIAIRFLLLKKLPKIFSYSLWSILLFRLISPVSFASAFSFFNLLKPGTRENTGVIQYVPVNIEMMKTPAIDVGISSINNAVNPSLPPAAELAGMNPMQLIQFISSAIWIIGVAGLILYSLISLWRVYSYVNTATLFHHKAAAKALDNMGLKRKVKVYVTDKVHSPFVFGFLIPRIYVPLTVSEKELHYILTHELVHIKRFDYIIKPFAYLIIILHWFNPILWLSFALMSRDMEMSCDEKVMEVLGDGIKEDYSYSLLSLTVRRSRIFQEAH